MNLLNQNDSLKLVKKYGINIPKYTIVNSKKSAISATKKIGYPVVMKILSKDIIHKTDAKGIILDIKNKTEAEKAYECLIKIIKKEKATFEGILVQETIKGTELIIGMKRDLQFGPVIMFGLGGIFVEVIKDVSFGITPITRKKAKEMILETKGLKILQGIRNTKKANLSSIIDIIMKISKLAINEKDIQEIDINPCIVNEKNAKAADIRVMIK